MIHISIQDVKSFFIGLFSCFSKKEKDDIKYCISSNGRDVILEDLETTYLFESDDNINYR
jgi:hypothetical protein